MCDARLEYFSAIELTRRQPRFLLTNRIGNKDVKLVNDIDWMKPQVSSPELAVGGVVEASYPTSNYVHDKDAPIKIWYQGCEAPAEAYLVTTEEKSAVDRLNSLLRRFVEGKPNSAESAEITVSLFKEPRILQLEILRRPANLIVALTGFEAWITPDWETVGQHAKMQGYSAFLKKPVERFSREQLKKFDAKWASETALFTQGDTGGETGFIKLDLPVRRADGRLTGYCSPRPPRRNRGRDRFVRNFRARAIAMATNLLKLGGIGFHRNVIIPLAARLRLPSVYPYRYCAAEGGLTSYGPDTVDQFRLAAGYVNPQEREAE